MNFFLPAFFQILMSCNCNPCMCNPCMCYQPAPPAVVKPLIPCCAPPCPPCGPAPLSALIACCPDPCNPYIIQVLPPCGKTIVPCLPADATFDIAQQIIASQSLIANKVDECSDSIPINTVIRTDPVGGVVVDVSSTVSVYVSTGPCVAGTGATGAESVEAGPTGP